MPLLAALGAERAVRVPPGLRSRGSYDGPCAITGVTTDKVSSFED